MVGTAWSAWTALCAWMYSEEQKRLRAALARWRERDDWKHICNAYSLSAEGGFLPEMCVERLEPEELQVWERLIDILPELNRTGKIKQAIDGMPMCSTEALGNDLELRRAYIILCHLLHSYVHHAKVPWERLDSSSYTPTPTINTAQDAHPIPIPAALAVPLYSVCKRLGLPPVLTAVVDLWNWRRKLHPGESASGNVSEGRASGCGRAGVRERTCPGTRPGDLQVLSSMTGSNTEAYFHLVPCSIQAVMGPLVIQMYQAPTHLFSHVCPLQTRGGGRWEAGVEVCVRVCACTQFTCFTSTKVPILTQKARRCRWFAKQNS
jgi:hypothetical protein